MLAGETKCPRPPGKFYICAPFPSVWSEMMGTALLLLERVYAGVFTHEESNRLPCVAKLFSQSVPQKARKIRTWGRPTFGDGFHNSLQQMPEPEIFEVNSKGSDDGIYT